MYSRFKMDEGYRSLETVNPDAWVQHFKNSVGKPSLWYTDPQLVLLKSNNNKNVNANSSKQLPITVVSPAEQYDNMAQASVDKTTPSYKVSSVRGKSSGRTQAKKRKRKRRKETNESQKRVSRKRRNKGKQQKSKRRRKRDIFG